MIEKPELSFEMIKRMEDMSYFTSAKIFDDLLIVTQAETCCYVWKTAEGLVIFDGIWPDERAFEAVMQAISGAGWQSEMIAGFVMTHGHIDHVGCGKWFVDRFGTKTYLSEQDDILRRSTSHEEGRSDSWKEFEIDTYLNDGDVLTFGEKQVYVVATPGHTEGCMSFIFPVTENKEKHIAAFFGGATAPWNDPNGKTVQLQSIEKFKMISLQKHADVALTNHTAFDQGAERIAYSQNRMKHMPNIYILGENGVQKFCEVYRNVAE